MFVGCTNQMFAVAHATVNCWSKCVFVYRDIKSRTNFLFVKQKVNLLKSNYLMKGIEKLKVKVKQ